MLTLMLDPQYKCLGMVIMLANKGFQIISEHDREVSFPLLLCANKILNSTNANERGIGM
jgi:hypothetical protein